MVLAFTITNDEGGIQSDLILTQDKEGFKLRHRVGFVTISEERFEEEEAAFQAFEKEEAAE